MTDADRLACALADPAYLLAFAEELAPLLAAEVTRLRERLATEVRQSDRLADLLETAQDERDAVQLICKGLIDRVAAQSELLSRRAEKPLTPADPDC